MLPELAEWNNGKGIDLKSWIGCSGNFRLAIGYSAIFWPRFVGQTISKHAILAATTARLLLMKMAIEHDPNARAYVDQTLQPVRDDEDTALDLLTQTTGALAAIAHVKKIAALTGPSPGVHGVDQPAPAR